MRVRSADGTRLAVTRRGRGRPVVLVHGSACDSGCWSPLADHLEQHFDLFMPDRRGHGASDRGASDYSLDREAEDILAVLEAAGPEAIVLAHSWGARCAIEALIAGASPVAAILYEPLDSRYRHYDRATLEHFIQLERDGPPEAALRFYFGTMAQVPSALLDAMRGGEDWVMAEAALGTLARESRAWFDAPIDRQALAAVDLPVRLVLGTRSPTTYRTSAQSMARALPDAEITTLDGQGHVAHLRAPVVIAALVRQVAADLKGRERC